MKKFGRLVLLITTLSIVLSGCGQTKALDAYKLAMAKTDTIMREENATEGSVRIVTEDTEKEIKYHAEGKYDKESERYISQVYYEYDQLGQDVVYYQENSDTRYLYLSVIGKYIDLSQTFEVETTQAEEDGIQEAFAKLGAEITDLLEDENVFRGENVLIQNEDGEVKATKYTITLKEDQLLEVSQLLIDMVNQNRDVFESFGDMTLDDNLQNWRISSFSMISYVDFDDYIISEEIAGTVTNSDMTIQFENKTDLWQINESLSFEFPHVDSNDWIEFETLTQTDDIQDN